MAIVLPPVPVAPPSSFSPATVSSAAVRRRKTPTPAAVGVAVPVAVGVAFPLPFYPEGVLDAPPLLQLRDEVEALVPGAPALPTKAVKLHDVGSVPQEGQQRQDGRLVLQTGVSERLRRGEGRVRH